MRMAPSLSHSEDTFPTTSKHAEWALVENKKDVHRPHTQIQIQYRAMDLFQGWPVHRSSDFVCCLFPLRPPVQGRKACPGRTPIYKHIQMASSSYVKLDTFPMSPTVNHYYRSSHQHTGQVSETQPIPVPLQVTGTYLYDPAMILTNSIFPVSPSSIQPSPSQDPPRKEKAVLRYYYLRGENMANPISTEHRATRGMERER
jgi:hypothetical protein